MADAQIPVHPGQSPRISSQFGVMVREDVAFSNAKGEEKKGIRKQAEKALEKLQEPLRKFLEPDEAVFYIAPVQIMPGGIEQAFLGWHAMFLSPAVMVLTNRRILHLLVRSNGAWRRSVRCAGWGDVDEVVVKGFMGARLSLKYRSGQTEVFSMTDRNLRKKVQPLAQVIKAADTGESWPSLGVTNFCPECRSILSAGTYECPHCRLVFKDEKAATQRSWLIPGGGFFYTGHTVLGLLHALVEGILTIVALYWVLVAAGVITQQSDSGDAPLDKTGALVVVALVVAILAIDKWVMARVAVKQVRNYLPTS